MSGATLLGVFSGDVVILNTAGVAGTFTSQNVGTGITVTVAGLTISGAQAGDYTLTEPTTTANITPAGLTATGIAAANKVYNANTAATLNTSGATLVGVLSGDTVTLNTGGATGNFASQNVGTGITVTVAGLTISGAQAGDYALTEPTTTANITPAGLTVSGITAANKVYNASTVATLNTSSATLVGVFSGDTVALKTSGATGTFASESVGTGITVTVAGLTISGAQTSDYALTEPTTTANITPAGLTVSGITAANKVYNASTVATINTSSATLVGVLSGDTVNLNTSGATGIFASQNVGTGITVTVAGLTISGAQAGDYTLTEPMTTANITPASLTVTGITAANKVYNASTAATLNTSGATLVGVLSGDTVNLNTSGATGTFASQNAGTGITGTVAGLTIRGAQAGDYTLTEPMTTANITPAGLTVTGIAAANKVYNANTAATLNTSGATLVGVLSGDTVTLNTSGATGIFASQDVGTGITVTVAGLTIRGAQAGDYTLTEPMTTANITPAGLTVTGIAAANKVYNANTAATLNTSGATLVGVLSGDTVNLNTSGATGIFASQDVGTGITVTVAGLTISGAQAGDYALTEPITPANITPAGLTVTGITAANKVYNASTAATLNTSSATLVGVLSGDTVNLNTSGDTGTFASQNVGTGIAVTVAGLTISGAQAGDYTLSEPTTTANITSASLTVPGITAANKVYNASTAATLNTSSATLVGALSGDTVNLKTSGATGTFAFANVGTGITVTVAGLTISGAQAGDYTLSEPTTTANITPASLTVTGITAANKVYNASTAATLNTSSAALVGVVSGDTVNLNTAGATGTFASKNAGTGIAVTVAGPTISGAQAGDYTLTEPTTTANITPAALTVMGVGANNKVYDGTTSATLTYLRPALVGVISGDAVTLNTSAVTGTFASKNAGNKITVTVAGLALGGAQAADYALTQPTTMANITKATLTFTANNKTKVYGSANPPLTYTPTGFVNGENASVFTGAPTLSTTVTASTGVGSYAITIGLGTLSAANYSFALANGALTVTPATLKVTANNARRAVRSPNPTFADTITGFVNHDPHSVVSGAASLTTTATKNSPPGTYVITAARGTLRAANYVFVFVNGVLTIT